MTPDQPASWRYRVAELPAKKPLRFTLEPAPAPLAAMAAELGASALKKVKLAGEFRPAGRHDVVLEARLTGTAVQPCVVTLAPVTTRIDEPVLRRYVADMPMPEGDEIEMPEDDSAEPLPEVIDLGAVLAEALALALPLYPRAAGVDLADTAVAPPGAAPIEAEKPRPFAGLAALKARLEGEDDAGG